SDDEDYTVIFDKNSFSYKIIYVNDLKLDSENDNEKVNMPSFPIPEPKVSCFDDLDFFKDFENEFLAIVYNDALTFKSYFLTKPTLSPQHIDEFDLKDETSLFEYDEVEQDDTQGQKKFLEASHDKINKIFNVESFIVELKVEGYTEEIVHDFEDRLETIFERQVNRVHVLDFEGLTPKMRHDLAERLRMVYTRDDWQEIFVSYAWRSFLALGLHTTEEMTEGGFEAYWLGSERVIPDKGDLSDYWIEISFDKGFLRSAPSYTYIKDPLQRLCHRHTEGRKSGARLSRGHFIGRLAHHFGLVSDDGLRGLSVVTSELPLIDMGELVKLNIYMEVGDDWARAVPAPIHAPPPPPPAAGRTMAQRLGRLEEEIQGLLQDVRSLRGLVERSMTDQGRFSTWMISCMM
ncbi:hypothetical protein Tco_0967174, partial [Tanacetum coccineum]